MSDAAKEQVVTKETGTVKWFNPSKGFGFLRLSGNREDIFVHYSQIQVEGYKTLQQDEPVEFQIEQTPKGFQAVNVTKVTTKYPPRNKLPQIIVSWSREPSQGIKSMLQKNQMPELAKKILEFIVDREDDCGRLSNYEILLCRIDGDIYADEGLPYLLSKHLIDIPDPDALTYRVTPAGRSALHTLHVFQALRDLASERAALQKGEYGRSR